MLINLSNHPSQNWDIKQKNTAIEKYGEILDIAFPAIPPEATTADVYLIAEDYFDKITQSLDLCANTPTQHAVHIQGEFTFVFKLVSLLRSSGIACVASTSNRNVTELSNGEKIIKFSFVQFREY